MQSTHWNNMGKDYSPSTNEAKGTKSEKHQINVKTVTCVLSFGFAVASYAMPRWATNQQTKVTFGMLMECDDQRCQWLDSDDSKTQMIPAFLFNTLSVAYLFWAIIVQLYLFIHLNKNGEKNNMSTTQNFFQPLAAASGCLGNTIFTATYHSPLYSYGLSYILGWVAFGINCVGMILASNCSETVTGFRKECDMDRSEEKKKQSEILV